MTEQVTPLYDMSGADIISLDDLTARLEQLEPIRQPGPVDISDVDNENAQDDLFAELASIADILEDLEGCGGSVQWRGSWYPGYLISDSHFVDFCRQEAEEMVFSRGEAPGWLVIDWEKTADNMRQDYSPVRIDGNDYWYRG